MIKDFTTYINEGLFDRNQSEFAVRKTDKGIEQIYIPETNDELYSYIDIAIENAKKEGTYPDVDLNNIDVSKLWNDGLEGLFGDMYNQINPDISNWDIKYIPIKFFDNNKHIKEFIIPDSVTNIRRSAFYGCTGLTSVTIPDSVTNIDGWAFSHCSSLKSIEIPNSITDIKNYTFYCCDSLTSVTIDNGVINIGDGTFYGCTKLASVTIPDSVTSIGGGAFYDCDSLTSVTISKDCIIGASSFPKNCKIIRK